MPYDILDAAEITRDLAAVARTIGLDESEIGPTIASGLKAGGQCPRRLPFLKSNDRIKLGEPPVKSDDELAAELASLGETDTDNGQRFVSRFGTKVINTPGRGWLIHDGKRWLRDDLLQVKELAKTLESGTICFQFTLLMAADFIRRPSSRSPCASQEPIICSGAFLCSDRVSIGKALRCVSRFVSHRPHTKWNSGSRNRTDSE